MSTEDLLRVREYVAARPPATARPAAITAVIIQAVALGLGIIAWAGSIRLVGGLAPLMEALGLAVTAVGLVLSVALLRSLRPAQTPH